MLFRSVGAVCIITAVDLGIGSNGLVITSDPSPGQSTFNIVNMGDVRSGADEILDVYTIIPCEDCKEEYPPQVTLAARPTDDYFVVYYGDKSNPSIDDSQLIKSLDQQWRDDKLNIDVAITANDEYIYIAYPFSEGAAANIEIDTNPEAFSFSQVSITDITGTQDYYIYRSDAKWTGEFQVQVT